MRLLRLLIVFAIACTAAGVVHAQAAAAPESRTALRVIAFAGGWNLPLWAAQRQGFFEKQGIAIELAYTPSSGALINGLMAGRYDIALAAIDNLVAYQEGQGDGPPLHDPDLVAVMGVDNG
ncbi:MAG TPA: ABC transporter substrate-binding protein, partial [Caldimonas sp.]